MGCDIHMYSETFIDNEWVADEASTYIPADDENFSKMAEFNNTPRNYWFFGLIASGVRSDFPWSLEDKGFPEDASKEIADMYSQWGSDAHTPSYLTHLELENLYNTLPIIQAEQLISQTDSHYSDALLAHKLALKEHIDGFDPGVDKSHQRIVFWFDN